MNNYKKDKKGVKKIIITREVDKQAEKNPFQLAVFESHDRGEKHVQLQPDPAFLDANRKYLLKFKFDVCFKIVRNSLARLEVCMYNKQVKTSGRLRLKTTFRFYLEGIK